MAWIESIDMQIILVANLKIFRTMKLKDNVNKAKLFRELTEVGKKRFEFTREPDEDLKVFLDGAEAVFKLLRLPVVGNSGKPNHFISLK